MLFICAVFLPALVVSQTTFQTPEINAQLAGSVNSLRERIDLVLDQNDFNNDGDVDLSDIDMDLLRYQRDSDLCCMSSAEWVDQQTSVYGVSQEFAASRFPESDCLLNADELSQVFPPSLTYEQFENIQIDALNAFCGTNADLYTTNNECVQLMDLLLNDAQGLCNVADITADRQTACDTARQNFQTVCAGQQTAGLQDPAIVNDANRPTLQQNCALLN